MLASVGSLFTTRRHGCARALLSSKDSRRAVSASPRRIHRTLLRRAGFAEALMRGLVLAERSP